MLRYVLRQVVNALHTSGCTAQNVKEFYKKLVIAKILNYYFASVFTTNDRDIRTLGVPDIQVSQEGVFEALLNLKTKKTCGPDNIHNSFLKRYME